ncbi:MAG: hypothetical protein AB7O59_06080 [Pirellulales bacterium]
MSGTLNKAVLNISIDLDAVPADQSLTERRSLVTLVDRLLEQFARHHLPATWSLGEPSTAMATQRILAVRGGHEIGLLIAPPSSVPSSSAPLADRVAAQDVARRLLAARQLGIRVDTLALAAGDVSQHAALAVKHTLVALRHAAIDGTSRPRMPAAALRFGLWSFPVTSQLPGTSRWLPGGGGGRTLRALIEHAIHATGLVTLVIDGPRLAARGSAAQRTVAGVLAHAARRQRQGLLEVATIGATAKRLASRYESAPSRSILRAA